MSPIFTTLAPGLFEAGAKLIDRLIPDPAQREAISQTLWETAPEAFLANGLAGEGHDARQPILISDRCDAANGATHVIFADGVWDDAARGFARSFLLFGEATLPDARACWRGRSCGCASRLRRGQKGLRRCR